MRCRSTVLALVAGVFLLGACGGSDELSFGEQTPVQFATELIESEAMAQRLGIDTLTATTCTSPVDQRVGTTFPCVAQSNGQAVEFDVLLEGDEKLFAGPLNVVDASDLRVLEQDAVRSLNRTNGFEFPDDALECGDRSVILDSAAQMQCTLTDAASGTAFDTVVTITNIDVLSFMVEVIGEAG